MCAGKCNPKDMSHFETCLLKFQNRELGSRSLPSSLWYVKELGSERLPSSLWYESSSRGNGVAYPIVGITPSCCSMPRLSKLSHCSAILPFATRKMLIPEVVTCLPVAGIPINSPLCVPRQP